MIIVGRNFLPSETGAYDQILGVITIGQYIFSLNIKSYMLRIIPGADEGRRVSLYKTLIFLESLTAIGLIIIVVLLKGDLFFCKIIKISEFSNILRLGLIIIVIQIIAMGFIRFNSAIKEIEFANFIAFFNSGFWIILLLIIWGIGIKINLLIFLLSWIFGACLTIALGLKKIGVAGFIKSKIDSSIIKNAYLFGAPLVFSAIGYNLVSASGRFILSHYHTASAAGIYFAAYRPLSMVYDFVAAVGITVFIPYVIEAHNNNNFEKKSYYLSIMTKYTFAAALPIILGIFIARHDLIRLIFNKPEYWESANIIPYIIFMPLLYIFIYPSHYTLFLKNKTSLIGGTYLIGGFINVGLNLLLIPKYSYYGAAISTVFSLFLILIAFYILSWKQINLKWDFIKIFRLLFVTLITWTISTVLYKYLEDFSVEFVRLVLLGVFILIIYIIGLYFFSVFESKEIETLKQYFNKTLRKSQINATNGL